MDNGGCGASAAMWLNFSSDYPSCYTNQKLTLLVFLGILQLILLTAIYWKHFDAIR
jgi:hypothetical protein